ncbi:alpha-glucan family phosphorylase [Methanoculleus taiwanensis]|nr:alpha-glucan family phosphorylase [Methanoculleus taiwanensis]
MIVKDPISGSPVDTETAEYRADAWGKTYYFDSEIHRRRFLEGSRVAYFSMEIGLSSDIPTYSGGLGVLAGDAVRSSADLRIPLVAVTLVSRKGYLRQKITGDGVQQELPDEWNPAQYMRLLPRTVTVRIEGRDVHIRAWFHDHESPVGGLVPVILLDTDMEENAPDDRQITSYLYGSDSAYRLRQEIVLGIGGVKMLKALNFRVERYHMNEGHSSLLTLELMRMNGYDADTAGDMCVFTTHTPVAAAMDTFSYDDVEKALDFPIDTLKKYGGEDRLNLTLLALNMSKYHNGVAKAHQEYSQKLFHGYHIREITNGVHPFTWTSPEFQRLFDRYMHGWANEPELLVRVGKIPNEEIWDAHVKAKAALIDDVHESTGVTLDPEVLTIGFARRATGYKRATLIFSDLDRLKEINRKWPIQLLFSGKAHPHDEGGKQLIKDIYAFRDRLKGEIEVVYLENYSMDLAGKLTSGVDVWLNTPLPPMEASGTSGMKAAFNGVMNFSVLDGWWVEGCVEGVTGWAIGPGPDEPVTEERRRAQELRDLYNKLEYVILPLYYSMEDEWTHRMKNAIGLIAYYFNSHVMMRRYASEAYL